MSVTRAAEAVLLAVGLLPVSAAAADAPLPVTPPAIDVAAPSLPAGPLPLAAPPVAVSSASCPGARRRSGAKRRQAAVRCLVDQARARAGLRGFRGSRTLALAARRHARDMARRRYFAHQLTGGPSLSGRARAAGWRGHRIGEAIAYGCGSLSSPVSIVRGWLASPPHRAILLSSDLARVGVGVAGRPPVACGGRGATFVLDAGR